MRLIRPGAPISPSGRVKMAPCGRRGIIQWGQTGICTWCGQEVKPPRQTWCSPECVDAYLGTQPGTLRSRVLLEALIDGVCQCSLCGGPNACEMDHTHPIVEGGHPFDRANLRALCTSCHRRETAALAARRAQRRRVA